MSQIFNSLAGTYTQLKCDLPQLQSFNVSALYSVMIVTGGLNQSQFFTLRVPFGKNPVGEGGGGTPWKF